MERKERAKREFENFSLKKFAVCLWFTTANKELFEKKKKNIYKIEDRWAVLISTLFM